MSTFEKGQPRKEVELKKIFEVEQSPFDKLSLHDNCGSSYQ